MKDSVVNRIAAARDRLDLQLQAARLYKKDLMAQIDRTDTQLIALATKFEDSSQRAIAARRQVENLTARLDAVEAEGRAMSLQIARLHTEIESTVRRHANDSRRGRNATTKKIAQMLVPKSADTMAVRTRVAVLVNELRAPELRTVSSVERVPGLDDLAELLRLAAEVLGL